ncbi:MAG: C40 family peptidase [Prevotellaceae bacterium]|jgi:LysM repeat protein|nr:C40 family peptidase [Prevotellaceae bacterium]
MKNLNKHILTWQICLCFLLFVLCSTTTVSAQFFDEEDYEEPIDTTEIDTIIPPEKASVYLVDSIIAFSKIFLGTPYHYGGTTPAGFDCSGFMQYLFKNFGINIQRTATAQYLSPTHIDKDKVKKGDLVFFEGRRIKNSIGHVGMVISDSVENGVFQFIHASVAGLRISKSTEPYYSARLRSGCRILETESNVLMEKSISTEKMPEKAAQTTEKEIIYVVKQGDTLYAIAKKYGTTVAKIRKDNHLTSDNLKIKQRLKIKR